MKVVVGEAMVNEGNNVKEKCLCFYENRISVGIYYGLTDYVPFSGSGFVEESNITEPGSLYGSVGTVLICLEIRQGAIGINRKSTEIH